MSSESEKDVEQVVSEDKQDIDIVIVEEDKENENENNVKSEVPTVTITFQVGSTEEYVSSTRRSVTYEEIEGDMSDPKTGHIFTVEVPADGLPEADLMSRLPNNGKGFAGLVDRTCEVMYPFELIARSPKSFTKGTFTLRPIIIPPTLKDTPAEDLPALMYPDLAWKNLTAENEVTRSEACHQLVDQLKYYGYARIEFEETEGLQKVMNEIDSAAHEFFDLPLETKALCRDTWANNEGSSGYAHTQLRDTFSLNINHKLSYKTKSSCFKKVGRPLAKSDKDFGVKAGVPFPFPENVRVDAPSFKPAIVNLYDFLYGTSNNLMNMIATGLEIPETALTSCVPKTPDQTPWTFESMQRVFRYHKQDPTDALLCVDHFDVSLLTLLPATPVKELEVVRRCDGKWIKAETGSEHGKHLLFFPGMYFGRLVGGLISPTIHRVTWGDGKARISTPFFLRPGRSSKLSSSYLGKAESDDGRYVPEAMMQETSAERLFFDVMLKAPPAVSGFPGIPRNVEE